MLKTAHFWAFGADYTWHILGMSDVEIMKVEKAGTTTFTYSIWYGMS